MPSLDVSPSLQLLANGQNSLTRRTTEKILTHTHTHIYIRTSLAHVREMDLAISSNKTLTAGVPLYFVEVVKYAMECS